MSSPVWRGFRATVPVALSIMPFGIAYGAVASQSMAPWRGVLMSVLVFAGTAQFVTASMLAQGSGCLPILITALLLNLRLILLSAAISPHIRHAPASLQPLFAHMLTDESFAVSMAEFECRPASPWFFIGSGLTIFGFWQMATVTGLFLGSSLPQGVGLEYALPATLVCLIFMLVRGRRGVVVAILAASLSLALLPVVSSTWSVMVATLVAATVGVLWNRWR
jgi:4-azaleucine resistance transporter AzlC